MCSPTLPAFSCLLSYAFVSAAHLTARESVPLSSDAAGDCVFMQRAAHLQAGTTGALRGNDCDEASWPDKDHNLVCGECKVLVDRFSSFYKTCSGYCASIGRLCTGAWEEQNDDCAVQRGLTCDESIASSDAICECGAEAAAVGDTCYGEFPELAVEEGSTVGEQLSSASLAECEAACDGNPACNSFSLCPQWGCWMKDQSFSGSESTKSHYGCQTYYKKACTGAGTPDPTPSPTPAATAEQYCFGELPHLAVEEGNTVGEQVYTASATECQRACDNNPACNSFSLCPQWGCWMKDKSFSGNEATKEFYDCQTYYKTRQCDNSSGGGVPMPTSAPTTPSTLVTVKVMSYNTEYVGYPSRVSQYGAKVREVGAVVVGTQECQDKLALSNAAGYSVVPGTGFQNPILYNPGKVSYVEGTGGYMQIPNDNYAERTVTWAQFRTGGAAWWFFNTHLPHPHGAAASRNTHAGIANMVLQKRRELGAGDSATVVTGDMNPFASSGASEGSFESNLVAGGFFKAYQGRGNPGYGGLDKIFASSAHWTASNGADHGTGGSDHPAIAVDLTLKA